MFLSVLQEIYRSQAAFLPGERVSKKDLANVVQSLERVSVGDTHTETHMHIHTHTRKHTYIHTQTNAHSCTYCFVDHCTSMKKPKCVYALTCGVRSMM